MTATPLAEVSADLTWKELEHRFRELQAEMRADCLMNYTRFCWDDGATAEKWNDLGGDERSRRRFQALASTGARKLGFTENANADSCWLARVREYLGLKIKPTGTQTVDGRTATTEGLWIRRVAEASADFCLQLIARGTPESPVLTEFEPVTSEEAWELMRNDFTLREQLISPELKKQFQPEITAVYSRRTAGGEGAWVHARADLEINQTNRTAERYFDACCEVWDVQGRRKVRAFFLGVLHYCLIPLFETRRSCFCADIQARHSHLKTGLALHLRYFHQEMDKLCSKWSTKIEIASRNNEYQQDIPRQSRVDSPARAEVSQRQLQAPPLQIKSGDGLPNISKPGRGRRSGKLSPAERKRRGVIFGALQCALTGRKYCDALDRGKLAIPAEWKEEGCPPTYSTAYLQEKWRQRIQNEKSKYKARYVAASSAERESLIQQSVAKIGH